MIFIMSFELLHVVKYKALLSSTKRSLTGKKERINLRVLFLSHNNDKILNTFRLVHVLILCQMLQKRKKRAAQ